MNKQEIVEKMADAANISKVAAETALDAFLDGVVNTLVDGDKVSITGFGSWEVSHRAARKGRNPQTGAEIDIAAMDVPKFKAGKGFKDAVNQK